MEQEGALAFLASPDTLSKSQPRGPSLEPDLIYRFPSMTQQPPSPDLIPGSLIRGWAVKDEA